MRLGLVGLKKSRSDRPHQSCRLLVVVEVPGHLAGREPGLRTDAHRPQAPLPPEILHVLGSGVEDAGHLGQREQSLHHDSFP
jgi:hypothetical protein